MRTGQEKPTHLRTEFTRAFVFSLLGVFPSFSSFWSFFEFSPFGSSGVFASFREFSRVFVDFCGLIKFGEFL